MLAIIGTCKRIWWCLSEQWGWEYIRKFRVKRKLLFGNSYGSFRVAYWWSKHKLEQTGRVSEIHSPHCGVAAARPRDGAFSSTRPPTEEESEEIARKDRIKKRKIMKRMPAARSNARRSEICKRLFEAEKWRWASWSFKPNNLRRINWLGLYKHF